MDNNHDIFFIRHAQSQFNMASHNFRQKNNIPYVWQILCQYPQFIKGVKYNPQYLDCSLTQKGIKQCLKTRQKIIKDLQIDAIIVSPLQRTLQTCHNIFQNHNIPVFVQPVLSQALRSSCDLSNHIQHKIKKYPKYNFDNVQAHGQFWFIKNQSQQNQQKYYQLLQKSTATTLHEKNKQILNYMADTMIYQLPQNLRKRGYKIKQMLRRYKDRYNKIAVVAHYNTINYTLSREFDYKNQPVNSANIRNCQVKGDNLDELLTYK